ncbi:MAG: 1-phosphofructokinase family hexose kinase [Comamonadaceae bacterium]
MTDILTLTMNPALDIASSTERVQPTHKLRSGDEQEHPGGGGVNVARVVHRLGGDCAAIFPAGGFTGELLCRLLDEEGVIGLPVEIAGETRESFSVRETSTGQQFRFVLAGPTLSEPEWQRCLDRVFTPGMAPRYLVASGSLPPGVPDDFYVRLIRLLKPQGVKVVLDSSGPALAAALEEGVYLVKPSLRELRELFKQPLETKAQWLSAAAQLVAQGKAEIVVLSLGTGGAWMISAEGKCFAPALHVPVLGSIGAGDSFVGAMVWALARGLPLRDAFRYGVAAGSAALLSSGTGLCQPQDVERLYGEVILV